MNILFHEMAPTKDFQFNCRSKSENHFPRYNKTNKSAAISKLEPTNQEYLSGNDDRSAALKIISNLLMEDEEEDKACVIHDSLALKAIEKSFYDALHNIDLDQKPLVFDFDPSMDDFFDFQFLSSSSSSSHAPSERYFDPFHPNNNYDSQQNNYKKTSNDDDCARIVKTKRNVSETLDDDEVLFCINSDLVMQINGSVSEEQSQAKKNRKCSRR